MYEIERKFLVGESLEKVVGDIVPMKVEQCYLPKTGDWTVRVRRVSNPQGQVSCTQTMKRRVSERKCIELEHTITDEHFEKVRALAGPILEKHRYPLVYEDHAWEIDVFPQFQNLVVAEIELEHEDEKFARPDWLCQEVTHDKLYKNAKMAKRL